ncbi:MAG TPA: hypothetical protein PKZ32_02255 [Candidatus Melainabacteria bacterium]|nr:hypothetical protein [Candidatus Melainabacteria bacterium]
MPTGGESIVALEHLDSHIKAILKLKLRAFVHLNPCFDSMHSIDASRGLAHTKRNSLEIAKPAVQPLYDFPPIPDASFAPRETDLSAAEQYTTKTPYSIEASAQSADCPNRFASPRLRRRARV